MAYVGPVGALRVAVVAALSAVASGVGAAAFADELDCGAPWTLAPSLTGADLFGVAGDAAGGFVAVGLGGTILVARDGAGWEQVDAGTTADLLGVTAGDGRLVAVGAGGTVVTSDDGVAWIVRPTPTTGRLMGVAWDGSRFVAVGAGGGALFKGVILSSADGATWTDRTPERVSPLLGVTWDGQRFVAVGWVGALATSADGLDWDVRTLGDVLQGCWFMLRPSYLYSVAGNGSLLVAVGLVVGDQYPGLGVSLASPDGEAWSCAQTELPPDQFRFRAVAWTGADFVAVGLGGGIGRGADGLAWTRDPAPATPNLLAVAAGRRALVAVGERGTVVAKVCPAARTPRRRLERRP